MDSVQNGLRELSILKIDAELTGLASRNREQILNHGLQLAHIFLDDQEIFILLVGRSSRQPIRVNRAERVNRGKGGTKLVRNMRQKIVPQLHRLLADSDHFRRTLLFSRQPRGMLVVGESRQLLLRTPELN